MLTRTSHEPTANPTTISHHESRGWWLDHAAPPEAIARVRVPSLVVRGEHDFVTAACVRGWEALPRARARTLDDASHHALLEKPDEYLAMLGGFLGECDEHEY